MNTRSKEAIHIGREWIKCKIDRLGDKLEIGRCVLRYYTDYNRNGIGTYSNGKTSETHNNTMDQTGSVVKSSAYSWKKVKFRYSNLTYGAPFLLNETSRTKVKKKTLGQRGTQKGELNRETQGK